MITLLLAAILSLDGTSAPQAESPAARSCHAMTWSPQLRGVVIYGGARLCGRDVVQDSSLWLWQGSSWRRLGALPFSREDAIVVFDSRRGRHLLFGGRNAGAVHEDTWELDGTRWRLVAPDGPGRVEHSAAAFDSTRGRVVLFGGGSRTGTWPRGTWEFDGTRWAQVDSSGPQPRVGHAIAATPGGVVIYGGFNEAAQFRDLWRWDGRRWARLDSAGPADSEGQTLVSLGRDSLALVAAQSGRYQVWVWTSGRWSARGNAGPPARTGLNVAYDPVRRRIVLFGGAVEGAQQSSGEVWEFDGATWSRVP